MNEDTKKYDVYLDVEATDIKVGTPMVIGVLLVNAATEEEITSQTIYCRVPDDAKWWGPDSDPDALKRKYERDFKAYCDEAMSDTLVAQTIQSLIPLDSRLCFFNCSNTDIPCLKRRFPTLAPFLDKFDTLDVAVKMAWKIWKTDQPRKRELDRIATTLQVPYDDLHLHTPVDDCKLAHRVKVQLDRVFACNELLQPYGQPPITGDTWPLVAMPNDPPMQVEPVVEAPVVEDDGESVEKFMGQFEQKPKSKKNPTPTVALTDDEVKQVESAITLDFLELPPCPVCGKKMIVQHRKNGDVFIGCEGYAEWPRTCNRTCNIDATKDFKDKPGQFIDPTLIPHRRAILNHLGKELDC